MNDHAEKNGTNEYLLQMKQIEKSFPGVKALNGAGIDVKYGEVVALCGENGAGKSTLMKCLYGSYRADAGETLPGKTGAFYGSGAGQGSRYHSDFPGIIAGHGSDGCREHVSRQPAKNGIKLNWKKMNAAAQEVLNELHSEVKATDLIRNLPIAQQQMVEIARGIALGAQLLILDEPTSSLTEREKIICSR